MGVSRPGSCRAVRAAVCGVVLLGIGAAVSMGAQTGVIAGRVTTAVPGSIEPLTVTTNVDVCGETVPTSRSSLMQRVGWRTPSSRSWGLPRRLGLRRFSCRTTAAAFSLACRCHVPASK